MSREQLTDQQSEQAAGESVADAKGDIYGLPPHLYRQIKSLRYGDAEGLATLLSLHKELSRQILGVASSQVGLTAVKQAMAKREHNRVAAPSAPDASIVGDAFAGPNVVAPSAPDASIVGDAFAGPNVVAPSAPDASIVGDTFAGPNVVAPSAPDASIVGDTFAPGPSAKAPAAPGGAESAAAAEPAWIRTALRYNEQHADLVAEFNELTQRSCVLDGKQLDPVAVSEWQRMHGLAADAKIGPMTVAAARKTAASASASAAHAPAKEARIPV